MSVLHEKFGFIHVPKTGGTWAVHAMEHAGIELDILGEGRDRHVAYREIRAPFRFGFVREPAMWYRSFWAHKKRQRDYAANPHPFEEAVRSSTDFAGFVSTATSEVPCYLSKLYEFFLGPPGAIEYVGKQENLVEDLIAALQGAGVEFDPDDVRAVPPVNEGSDDMPEITPELQQLIVTSERPAYERFSYELVRGPA
jgi:hypothetical protein